MSLLITYGHGTESAEKTVEILKAAGVVSLIDIRTAPGSRNHHHFFRDEMAVWLPAAGIAYRHEKRLGGFRSNLAEGAPDTVWEKDSFKGYAVHMRSAEFAQGIGPVLAEAEYHQVAVMCAESVWWHCHRWLVADFASVARGFEVRHLMHDGRLDEHNPMDGIRLTEDGLLVYDGVKK